MVLSTQALRVKRKMSDDSNMDDWGDALKEQADAEMSQSEGYAQSPSNNENTWDDAVSEVSSTADEILDKPIPSQASELIRAGDVEQPEKAELEKVSSEVYGNMARLDKNILDDIEMEVEVLVGKTSVRVKDLLRYTQGSIVELDTPHDAPFIARVNGRVIAKGDIVVINDKLGLRLTEIVTSKDRLESQKDVI